MKNEYVGENFKAYMDGYKEGCKDTTYKLSVDDEGWNRYIPEEPVDEPMTQDEVDILRAIDEDDDLFGEGYNIGHADGYEIGYDKGFDDGYKEAGEYNVILDGELLDAFYDYKELILSKRKEPWGENHDHNHLIFELHRDFIALTETWVMNQVWDYWFKRKGEIDNE